MNILKKIMLLFLLASMAGCHPDMFILNINRDYQIEGLNMSTLNSLEVVRDNGLLLHPGGLISLRSPLVTQVNADFTVELLKGEGLRFSFRTVSNDYPNRPAIKFDYTGKKCTVWENDKVISEVDTVKANYQGPSRIRIQNDGPLMNIMVDCDTVYYGKTDLPCTEYVIIEAMESADAIIYGIDFSEITDIRKTLNVLEQTVKKDY